MFLNTYRCEKGLPCIRCRRIAQHLIVITANKDESPNQINGLSADAIHVVKEDDRIVALVAAACEACLERTIQNNINNGAQLVRDGHGNTRFVRPTKPEVH